MSPKPINVEDYGIRARKRLPKIIFDYLEGGADDETVLKHNHEVFERYRLMPRRLVDVSKRDTGIELFGRHQAAPFIIGPTGLNGALWPKGDILLARAAATAGIPFVLSTASNASIEDVAAASKGDLWFQLYIVQRKLAELMRFQPRSRLDEKLRYARTCYDHIAGLLGVGLAERLAKREFIILGDEAGEVTPASANFLSKLGVDLSGARAKRRVFFRPCVDWTERRPHIEGAVGAALANRCFEVKWIERVRDSRALTITPAGRRALMEVFAFAI